MEEKTPISAPESPFPLLIYHAKGILIAIFVGSPPEILRQPLWKSRPRTQFPLLVIELQASRFARSGRLIRLMNRTLVSRLISFLRPVRVLFELMAPVSIFCRPARVRRITRAVQSYPMSGSRLSACLVGVANNLGGKHMRGPIFAVVGVENGKFWSAVAQKILSRLVDPQRHFL